jgi:uncharacterized protein with HEPN domain
MDERTADRLLYLDAAISELGQLAGRRRDAYDADIAVARACQFDVRLVADLERLGDAWIGTHPTIPWPLLRGMRNRIAHDYRSVDDDIVWEVAGEHVPMRRNAVAAELKDARRHLTSGPE